MGYLAERFPRIFRVFFLSVLLFIPWMAEDEADFSAVLRCPLRSDRQGSTLRVGVQYLRGASCSGVARSRRPRRVTGAPESSVSVRAEGALSRVLHGSGDKRELHVTLACTTSPPQVLQS